MFQRDKESVLAMLLGNSSQLDKNLAKMKLSLKGNNNLRSMILLQQQGEWLNSSSQLCME
jgi:hypothetical protein